MFLGTCTSMAQLELCSGNTGEPIFFEDFGTGNDLVAIQPPASTTYQFRFPPKNGSYVISRLSSFFNWHNMIDHTPNDEVGRFLIINGDEDNAGEFYRRVVSGLCENTTYEFSSWLVNLLQPQNICKGSEKPVNVRFQIWNEDGTVLLASGDTGDLYSEEIPVWRQFGLVFTIPPGQSSVILKMINNGTGGCGNDLAIDDIAFKACGNGIEITNNDNDTSITVCEGSTVPLMVLSATTNGSVNTSYAYQWQQSADALTWMDIPGATMATYTTPSITDDRYYRVRVVQDPQNVSNPACYIFSNPFKVLFVPIPDPPISDGDMTFCEGTSTTLSSQVPSNVTIDWYDAPTGGNLLLSGSGFLPTAAAGTYYAEARSTIIPCTSTDRTAIQALQAENPVLSDETIERCEGTPAILSANYPNATAYLWNTGETTQAIETYTAGTYSVIVTNTQSCSGTKTIEVTDAPTVSPPISLGDQTFCEGSPASIAVLAAPDTTIDWYATPSGGIPLWENTAVIQPTAPGTYYAEATSNATHCSSVNRTAVTLGILEVPNIPDETVALCEGTMTTLAVNYPNSSYVWSTGATAPSIEIDQPGTYTVTVTNGVSCSSTKTFEVQQFSAPMAPLSNGDVSLCANENGFLSVQAAPGTTIDWYDAPTDGALVLSDSNSFSPTVSGTYYAEARSSAWGCISLSRTPIVFTLLDVPLLTDATLDLCEGSVATISADFPNATYQWNTGETAESIEINAAGTYSVMVTDAHSCSSTKTIEVRQLTAPAPPISNGDRSLCSNENGGLSVQVPQDMSVNWYDAPTGGTLLLADNTHFTPMASGIYYAEARSSLTNCTSLVRTPVQFTLLDVPILPDTSLDICEGSTAQISADFPNASYLWNTGETTETIEITQAGMYTVIVTDAQSCSDTKTIEVTQHPAPDPPTSNGDVAICADQSDPLSVQAPPNSSIHWYDAPSDGTLLMANSTSFSPSVSGTYYAEAISNASGCTSLTRTPVQFTVHELPVATNETLVLCEGSTALIGAQVADATYLWSTGEITETIEIDSAGTYTVTITNANGCSLVKTIEITDAPVVSAPDSTGNAVFCEDEISSIGVVAEPNTTIFWYDVPSGGIPLAEDSPTFWPTTSGTYYAEARSNTTQCPSIARTAINVVILDSPDLQDEVLDICSGNSPILSANFPNATYLWNTMETTESIQINQAGTYTVTVTNEQSCSRTKTFEVITFPTAQPLLKNGNRVFCEGEMATIEVLASPSTVVNWYDVPTGGTPLLEDSTIFHPTVAGTYYADAFSSTAPCASLSRTPVTVTFLKSPEVQDGSIDLCEGGETTISANFLNATYLWNTGQTSESIQIDQPGTYTVTVTNASSCSSIRTIEVLPLAAPDPPTSNGDLAICSYDSGSLSVRVPQNTTVHWYDAPSGGTLLMTNSTTFSPTSPGTYYAEARSTVTGCISTTRTPVQFTVFEPPSLIDESVDLCKGATITLSAELPDASYLWSTGEVAQEIEIDEAGTYTVTVTNAASCSTTKTVEVREWAAPDPPISNGDMAVCSYESRSLTVQVPQNTLVNWYNAASGGTLLIGNSTTFSPTTSGTYYAEAQSTLTNCISTARTPVQLTIFEPPTLTDENVDLCEGSIRILSADFQKASYRWSTGETTEDIEIDKAGTYTVTVTNGQSCSTTKTFEVRQLSAPDPPPNIGTLFVCENESAAFAVPMPQDITVTWYDAPSGGNQVLPPGTNFNPMDSGTFYAEALSVTTGCVSKTRTPVTVTFLENPKVQNESIALCEGSSTIVSAAYPNASYLWNTGETTESIEIDRSGTYIVTITTAPSCSSTKTIEVRQLTPPDPPVGTGDYSICSNERATLTVEVPQNSSVHWYDAPTGGTLLMANSPTLSPLEAGTYYAEAQSVLTGCVSKVRTPVQLTIVAPPKLTDETLALCDGTTTLISADFPNADYLWNTGETTEAIEINRAGTYTVRVGVGPSCTSTKTVVVQAYSVPAPPLGNGDVAVCEGESGILRVDVPQGTEVNWYDAPNGGNLLLENSREFSPTSSNIYYAEARSALTGCISTRRTPVRFTLFELPKTSHERIMLCEGTATVISADFPNASYQWNTGATTEAIEIDRAGIYTVTITNARSCSSTKTIEVVPLQAPDPPISNGDVSVCEGWDGILSVQVPQDVMVHWYDAPIGGNLLLENSNELNATNSGTYYAASFSSQSGCASASRTPILFTSHEIPSLTDETWELCNGDSLILSANYPNASYLWNTGATSETITTNETGTYTVQVTNGASCSSLKTIVITAAVDPAIQAIYSDGYDIIVVTPDDENFQYSLDGIRFQESPVFELKEGGMYTIFVRNGPGCQVIEQPFLHLVIPNFFTPNQDGYHDCFQPQGMTSATSYKIAIFDRLGAVVALSHDVDFCWDGKRNSIDLPASDYWYNIQYNDLIFKGHFSLKR